VTTFVTQWATTRVRAIAQQHGALVKNSGALTVGTGTAALLGFVYWWVAARSFSPKVIGTASAFISLTGFVGLIGECGIGTLLTGEIVQQRLEHRRGLITAAMIASLSLSLAFGGIALVLSKIASGTTLSPPGIDYFWVLIGCGLSGLSLLVDKAFVGMLQASFQMLRQFLFSTFKLGLVVVLALWISSETVILISWVGGMAASLILVESFMRRTGQSLIHPPNFKLLYTLRRKAAHHYMLDLSGQAPIVIMPYLVAVLLSPTANAVFTITWMVVIIAAIVPGALAGVLFPAIQAAPEEYRAKMTLSLGASLAFSLFIGLIIYLYSGTLLTIFNPTYATIGGSHLRFLGFGIIGHAIKSHVGAAARLNNRMRLASLWFGLASLFELACVAMGCLIGGLEGLSIGWTSALLIDGAMMLLLANPLVAHGSRSAPVGTDFKTKLITAQCSQSVKTAPD
jgi:O-antigen/teichoic acid export membrane protein